MTPIIHWGAEPPKKQAEYIEKLLEENSPEKIADRMEQELVAGFSWSERHEH